MIVIVVAIVAAVFIGSYFGKKTDTSTSSGGNTDSVLQHLSDADNKYTMPLKTVQKDYGPTIEQLGVKPQLFVTQNSPTTGNVNWISQYANGVRGIGVDGTVLFDVPASENHAVYPASKTLDHLNVHGLGGDVVIQVDQIFKMDNSGSSDLVSRPSLVTNVNTGGLPWPADDSIFIEV